MRKKDVSSLCRNKSTAHKACFYVVQKFIRLNYLLGFFLELLNGTLVDTTAFVNQMTGSSRLTRVDVSDNDDVDVNLFLAHFVVSSEFP